MENLDQLGQGYPFSETRFAAEPGRPSKPKPWLLKTNEYQTWRDSSQDNRFLWIKGKPGSGKSALMRKVAEVNAYEMRDQATIAFCSFNHSNRSVTESYRILLYQIFCRNFDAFIASNIFDLNPHRYGDRYYLEHLLNQAVEHLPRRLICFIDALDSCEECDREGMLAFLENLSSYTAKPLFCFSSRHYPNIAIRGGPVVVLEEQQGHNDAISTYIRKTLATISEPHHTRLVEEVIEKSSGMFLWAAEVTKKLQRLFDRGRVYEFEKSMDEVLPAMRDRLDGLAEEDGDLSGLLRCLQCVKYAKRPLQMRELFFAVQYGGDGQLDHTPVWLELRLEAFIIGISKGLVEVVKPCGMVQFIHHTIPNLFGENALSLHAPVAHAYLKQSCENYLQYPRSLTPSSKCSSLGGLIHNKFPFLHYALSYHGHHDHANESQDNTGLTDSQLVTAWYSKCDLAKPRYDRTHDKRPPETILDIEKSKKVKPSVD